MQRINYRNSDVMIEVTKQVRNAMYMPMQSRTHLFARLGATVHIMDEIGNVLANTMRHKYVALGENNWLNA
jgi:hypothetical protein